MSTYRILGDLGEWTFYQVEDKVANGPDRTLFGFTEAVPDGTRAGKPRFGTLYASLEHAMVAAVGEKYTGPRGAGGTGVGTAADWFMRMIGADQLRAAGRDGGKALVEVLKDPDVNMGNALTAHWIERKLEELGLFLARESPEPYRS